MNTTSASPADRDTTATTAAATTAPRRILVWDAPVRVFHWLMVLCFAGAWLTAESERLALLHVTLGYTMAGLVAFRVLWGLVGTRHARFASFVRGPGAALRYLGSLLRGRPQHHTGHNPAGALAVIGLLGLAALVTFTGWTLQSGAGIEDLHEGAASVMLALVGIHIVAVLASSLLHRENLVRAMFTGYKRGAPGEAIRGPWRTVAALLLAGVLGFWWWQWHGAPLGVPAGAAAVSGQAHPHDDN